MKRIKLIQEFIDEVDKMYEDDFFIRSVDEHPDENSFIVRVACNRFPTERDQENINKVILNMFPIERNEDEALIVTFMIRTGTPRKLNIRSGDTRLIRQIKRELSPIGEITDYISGARFNIHTWKWNEDEIHILKPGTKIYKIAPLQHNIGLIIYLDELLRVALTVPRKDFEKIYLEY